MVMTWQFGGEGIQRPMLGYRQCSAIHGRRADVLVQPLPGRLDRPYAVAASSGSGLPVKATSLVPAGSFGVMKKFIGQPGRRLCLKLTHHSGGQNTMSAASPEIYFCSLRYLRENALPGRG